MGRRRERPRRDALLDMVAALAISNTRLERRVAALEARVAELERQRPQIVRLGGGLVPARGLCHESCTRSPAFVAG